MVAPKGRFQSRTGYVRSVAKDDARRFVAEEFELPLEPVNRTARHGVEDAAAPTDRRARSLPALPDRPVAAEPARAGWLLRVWRRLLRLMTGRN